MSDPAAPRRRFSEAALEAAVRSADAAYLQGRRSLSSLERRSRGLRAAGEQVAGRMFRFGQRMIEQSPIPVPVLAKDAFSRMQDALRQLEHVIESGDVSSLKDRAQEFRRRGKVDVSADDYSAAAHRQEGRGRSRAQGRSSD